jgi:hypothetical protein
MSLDQEKFIPPQQAVLVRCKLETQTSHRAEQNSIAWTLKIIIIGTTACKYMPGLNRMSIWKNIRF